jgi:hypothetical protein
MPCDQTVDHHGVSLSLRAFSRYAYGFDIEFAIRRSGPLWQPVFAIGVEDDRHNDYAGRYYA